MTVDSFYLSASEDELLEEIGSTLLGDGLGAGGSDPREYLRVGKRWVTTKATELQAAVCRSNIAAQIKGNAADDVAILSVALIAHNAGWAAVALPVAAVIARRGLHAFCSTDVSS